MSRPCPRCGDNSAPYILTKKNVFRCKGCKGDYSATSKTIWHSPKIPMARRRQIIEAAVSGRSALSISRDLGIQYKTVWTTIMKFKTRLSRTGKYHEIDGPPRLSIPATIEGTHRKTPEDHEESHRGTRS